MGVYNIGLIMLVPFIDNTLITVEVRKDAKTLYELFRRPTDCEVINSNDLICLEKVIPSNLRFEFNGKGVVGLEKAIEEVKLNIKSSRHIYRDKQDIDLIEPEIKIHEPPNKRNILYMDLWGYRYRQSKRKK